jgi:hypothetical protein
MTRGQGKSEVIELRGHLGGDPDFLRAAAKAAVGATLEVGITEALGAAKSARSEGRLGYRSGYYERSLITRLAKSRTGSQSFRCLKRQQFRPAEGGDVPGTRAGWLRFLRGGPASQLRPRPGHQKHRPSGSPCCSCLSCDMGVDHGKNHVRQRLDDQTRTWRCRNPRAALHALRSN